MVSLISRKYYCFYDNSGATYNRILRAAQVQFKLQLNAWRIRSDVLNYFIYAADTVTCRVCKSMKLLQLLVVTSKYNSNLVSSD
jgi:hypothetical protein